MANEPPIRTPRPFFDETVGAASLAMTFVVFPVGLMLLDADGGAPDWLRIPLEAYGAIMDSLRGPDAHTAGEIANHLLLLIELYLGSYVVTRLLFHLYDVIRRSKIGTTMGHKFVDAVDWVVDRIDAVSRPRR
jgi:hypothetical protein